MQVLKKSSFTYIVSFDPCGATAVLTFRKENLDEDAVRMALAEATNHPSVEDMAFSKYLNFVSTYVCEKTGCECSCADADLFITWPCGADVENCTECDDIPAMYAEELEECDNCDGCVGCDGSHCDKGYENCTGCEGCDGLDEDDYDDENEEDCLCANCEKRNECPHYSEEDEVETEFAIAVNFPNSHEAITLICRDENGVDPHEIAAVANFAVKSIENANVALTEHEYVTLIAEAIAACGYDVDVYYAGIAMTVTPAETQD